MESVLIGEMLLMAYAVSNMHPTVDISAQGVRCLTHFGFTNHLTEHECPSDKVYKACGSSVEPTCNDR